MTDTYIARLYHTSVLHLDPLPNPQHLWEISALFSSHSGYHTSTLPPFWLRMNCTDNYLPPSDARGIFLTRAGGHRTGAQEGERGQDVTKRKQ